MPLLLTLGIATSRAFAGDDDAPTPIIEQFVVQPSVTDPGGKVTLKWKVQRAESVSISPAPGAVGPEGEVEITAGESATTYILTAMSGDQRRSSTIQLQIAPQPPTIGYFEAEPPEVAQGQNVVLNWSVVGQGAAVTIEPGDGSLLAPIGSVILQPEASIVYTLTATNAAGRAVDTLQVTVGAQALASPPEIVEFAANPPLIDLSAPGGERSETIQLSWSAQGADSVEIVGEEVRSGLPAEGMIDIPAPSRTTTYYLVANNSGGSATDEVTVEVAQPSDLAPPTPAMVVIPQPSDDAAGVVAPLLDGSTSGNTSEGAVAQSSAQYADPLPQVDLLSASPNPARVGDEVIVRWAVSRASTVSVRTSPSPPGTTPLVARAGVFRFVAKEDVAILLEASSSGGSTIRRQVGVRVLQAIQPVAAGVGGEGLPLVAEGGVLGASAVVNDTGEIWLYRAEQNRWQLAGTLGIQPVSVAIAGTAIFGVADDGTLRSLDLSSLDAKPPGAPSASPTAASAGRPAATPTALRLGSTLALPNTCHRAVAVTGHERPAGEDQIVPTLLIACAEPSPVVLAIPTNGATLGAARWSAKLVAEPAGMTLGSITGSTIVVRYPLFSPRAAKVDLIEIASGQVAEVALTGPVTAVTVSPDGATVVAALFDEAALMVVDRRGVAPRRLPMPSPVRSLSWASSAVERADAATGDGGAEPAPFVGGTDAFGEASPVVPTPTPLPANPSAAASTGTVLVTWFYRPGGSLVSLASWSPTTLIAAEISPERGIHVAVDDGRAIVVAAFGPNLGIAYPWVETGRAGA